MIRISDVTKYYDKICAVEHISLEIPEGIMFGLLGTNGAGKSTLLKMAAGILESDGGTIYIDDDLVYENPVCKEKIFYLPDMPYYFPNSSMADMAEFYKRQYPALEKEGIAYMAEKLNLDLRRPLRTFSKGMKRQAFLIFALCAGTKYLLCDEVFDGLDPIVTETMKELMRAEMKERRFTVIAASHKLKDLEDICHNIGIMHKGGILEAGDMRERAGNVCKFQCVFGENREEELKKEPWIVQYRRDGYFTTLIVRGRKEEIKAALEKKRPVFLGEISMTLEEIFMAEMEETGYDIRKVLQ